MDMSVFISAWETAVWLGSVIVFTGAMLLLVTAVFAVIASGLASVLDKWSKRHIEREGRR